MNTDEIVSSMRKEFGQKMYQEGKLTLNQAAEFCGTNVYDFMSLLSLSGIPVIDYDSKELENELKQF
jgi:predicted HTH domain antitoxin